MREDGTAIIQHVFGIYEAVTGLSRFESRPSIFNALLCHVTLLDETNTCASWDLFENEEMC